MTLPQRVAADADAVHPWCRVPLDHYVAHSERTAPGQRAMLADLLGATLRDTRPAQLLVVGCADGNGLEQVDPRFTRGVTGVDINPEYLARLSRRIPHPSFRLTLRCADAADCYYTRATFDLAHCALVLEYLHWRRLLTLLTLSLRARGILSVVLQTPSTEPVAIAPSQVATLRAVESLFSYVPGHDLVRWARSCGLDLEHAERRDLTAGQAFSVLRFRRMG